MFNTKDEESVDLQKRELKSLKRKNRYYQGMILLGTLQVSSLILCYYLGRSSKKSNG